MRLFLVQHAQAASKQTDPDRPLTEDGRRDIQKIAAFIKPLNLSVGYLWHSGKKRTAQTADALAEVVEIRTKMTAHEGLAPNDDVTVIKNEIEAAQHDIMLVGHLPFLSKLASLLLTGSESASTVAFKNGGIVCMDCFDENQWHLNWMIIPELLI